MNKPKPKKKTLSVPMSIAAYSTFERKARAALRTKAAYARIILEAAK